MSKTDTKSKHDLEWENRVLCSDESCIGVIGTDGRCKECGQVFNGKLPETFVQADTATEPDAQTEATPATPPLSDEPIDLQHRKDVDTDAEWENRVLCIDESCIGVIGSDGRCKECGKPYAQ
ncbi:MAG: hypothetical protein QNI95_04090 [Desulfobacterales bacterium]|nr:hypothetical protein [Desulfobacterales bacterium]